MTAPHLRITGDVHNWVRRYAEEVIESGAKHSLQIGDMGFHYLPLNRLPWKQHKFIGGNHENYDVYYDVPHALGDYGMETLGGLKFFYLRGAFSIDVKGRLKGERRTGVKSWWREEVLSKGDLLQAKQDFISRKPLTVITHTCPTEVARRIGKPEALRMFGFNPSTFTEPTQECLQECFEAWQPQTWIFGHFHKSLSFKQRGTQFICLNELESIDVDKKGRYKHMGLSGRLGQ